MTPAAFVDLFRDALTIVLILVSVIIVPSLIVGLIVAIFQATTSINEQTLSFLPRLIMTIVILMFMSGWMAQILIDYFHRMLAEIPHILY